MQMLLQKVQKWRVPIAGVDKACCNFFLSCFGSVFEPHFHVLAMKMLLRLAWSSSPHIVIRLPFRDINI
jgi:hypothetical protein